MKFKSTPSTQHPAPRTFWRYMPHAPRPTPHVYSQGFTLLLAALIASIVLALGTSIFGIVQKELILSSIGRDSQFAFYAADTGAECALYWDVRHQLFTSEIAPTEITCDGQTVPITTN